MKRSPGKDERSREGPPVVVVVAGDGGEGDTLMTVARSTSARVIGAPDVASTLELLARTRAALIVLAGGGTPNDVAACRSIRRVSAALLIVVAPRANADVKVAALDAGADDYLAKPFSARELEARVAAHVRRAGMSATQPPALVHVSDVTIDLVRRRVTRGSEIIELSRTEWSILEVLARQHGIPVSHEDLFRAVWKKPFAGHQNHLRVFVTLLRRKIERVRSEPQIIVTLPGFGYALGDST